MTADRTKAERALAFLAHELRPDWDEHGVAVILRGCSEKPLAQVAAAVLHCATHRTDQRTPACITRPGEHWSALDRMAGLEGTTRAPDAQSGSQCRVCGRPEQGCRIAASKSGDDHQFSPNLRTTRQPERPRS